MARITIEKELRQIPNKFVLAKVAAERALQLVRGLHTTVDNADNNKEVVQALREIAAGKVKPAEGD